ncbi:MAG: hydrogenase maturation nickel metallochaperone HypA [Anaerolineae bacterium]|nr:hydrogenase maturation nickel metallochaperone HypA [Anaerolineae bacterium]
MHELSVTQSILDIAVRHAEAARATQITHLYLVVGQLSSIIDDSVQFYWDIISKGTLAEGATLHFRRVKAELRCTHCDHQYSLEDALDFVCPVCGSQTTQFISGDQFYVEAIDIESTEETYDTSHSHCGTNLKRE